MVCTWSVHIVWTHNRTSALFDMWHMTVHRVCMRLIQMRKCICTGKAKHTCFHSSFFASHHPLAMRGKQFGAFAASHSPPQAEGRKRLWNRPHPIHCPQGSSTRVLSWQGRCLCRPPHKSPPGWIENTSRWRWSQLLNIECVFTKQGQ